MSSRINPNFLQEIKEYGEIHVEDCFNCGTCTAICPLTTSGTPFPRNNIRMLQLGLKGKLLESPDPWLCYYCGECTETCPRQADPAEAMMTMRRWLIAQYDRSGHGARLYTSSKAAWYAILRYSLVPVVLLILGHALSAFGVRGFESLGIVTDHVELNTFAPALWVWAVVLIDFAILGYRLFSNLINMYQIVMKPKETKIPLGIYLQELKTLVIHTLTQKRWLECDEEDHSRWFKHLLLISGYGIMLVLIVGMLWWFQTDAIYPLWHPQRWLGYYATIVLLYASGESLIGRIRKQEQIHKFSHHSDWLFPVFLFTGTLTGILVHIFRYAGWPWATYIIYVIHVMILIAMLDTEVGIGKWTHMFYRPMIMYFQAVKEKANEIQEVLAEAIA
ncbi:MAG: 4Fe-4S dicluster domain-containing protein [Chloroflexota bacterium]|nr:4Fe-4S dicluster domain-containing protein [Chloroflexota bacterium]